MTPERIAHLRIDLLAYSEYIFRARKGADMKRNHHQEQICTALERVVAGYTKRLIITMPPRSGKTDLAVINFISWCMGNFPHSHFIHASYSKTLAANNTYAVRSIMQHEAYKAVFGHTDLMDDSRAKDHFQTAHGGMVYATGAGGTITGFGAGGMDEGFSGAIIIDDATKASDGNSETMRNNVTDWFGNTMESRKNSPDTPIIIIQQRLHEDDLVGWLLGGGNGEEWELLKIPAIENDKSFWPEQFPIAMLRRMEQANPYVFAGQYMQLPAPQGGGIFKNDWWRYYVVTPLIEWRGIWADTAQKAGETNDYSVFQCWGRTEDGRAILLDQIRGRWEAPELLTQARAFWAKHQEKGSRSMGRLRSFRIEDKVSGTGLIQTLKREGIPVQGIQRHVGQDKVSRAMDVAPSVQSGLVLLPARAPWLSDFLSELATFPAGRNDDQVDVVSDAVADILLGSSKYPWVGFQ